MKKGLLFRQNIEYLSIEVDILYSIINNQIHDLNLIMN